MYRLIIATVLLAVVLAVLVLRRGNPVRTRAIKVTARTALHRGAFVAVVEVDGRRLLVGAGAQQITLLTELGPEPLAPVEPTTDGAGTPGPASAAAADSSGDQPPMSMLERVRRATTRVPRGDRP